jgi:tripartite-type tricarboxylate transporter receptor subunit TctC
MAALVVAAAVLWAAPRDGTTGAYPDTSRELRHIIPWRAGGGTDAAMRGFMGYFERHLGVRVVTENVPGGLSSVGLTMVRSAPADGYTLGTMTYDALTVEVLGLAPLTRARSWCRPPVGRTSPRSRARRLRSPAP